MKATANFKAILAGLALAGAIESAAGQASPAVYDVEILSDGTALFVSNIGASGQDGLVAAVDMNSGAIVWSESVPTTGPQSAQRLPNGNTLIADPGDNRVLEVNAAGQFLWDERDLLLRPSDARRLPNGNTLICDSGNHRVIEVNAAGQIVWQFGTTGVPGAGSTRLNSPHKCERLPNGNTMLVDTGNNRVIEVTAARQIVRSFASGLSAPHAAVRLANGNTLIADTGNQRTVELTLQGQLVRTLATEGVVYDVERLANGNTLCSGEFGIAEYTAAGQLVHLADSFFDIDPF